MAHYERERFVDLLVNELAVASLADLEEELATSGHVEAEDENAGLAVPEHVVGARPCGAATRGNMTCETHADR